MSSVNNNNNNHNHTATTTIIDSFEFIQHELENCFTTTTTCINNSISSTTTTSTNNNHNKIQLLQQQQNSCVSSNNNKSLTITTTTSTNTNNNKTTTTSKQQHQVVPLVYIHHHQIPSTSTTKFASLPIIKNNNNINNKTMNTNVVPQFQFATLSSSTSNNLVNSRKSTLLSLSSSTSSTTAGPAIISPMINNNVVVNKTTPQLLIQHQLNNKNNSNKPPIVPVSVSVVGASSLKTPSHGPYFTMLKPLSSTNVVASVESTSSQSLQQDISNNYHVNGQQLSSAKYVIGPMPKIIAKNRLPVTVTTNCHQLQPKIAFMPISLPSSQQIENKVFNFKIANGQIQAGPVLTTPTINHDNNEIMIMKDNDEMISNDDDREIIDLLEDDDSPMKSEKEYELSIVEDNDDDDTVMTGRSSIAAVIPQHDEFTTSLCSGDMDDDIHHQKSDGDDDNDNDDDDDNNVIVFNNNNINKDKEIIINESNSYNNKSMKGRGVSILKKKQHHQLLYQVDQQKQVVKTINFTNNQDNQSILDTNKDNNNIEITTTTTEQLISNVEPPKPKQPHKTERRRKSNFSYRKDYDDIEIVVENRDKFRTTNTTLLDDINSDITLTKLSESSNVVDVNNVKAGDFVDIELIKEKSIKMNNVDSFDYQKVMKWNELGVATLPGSDLKFMINEFNLLEFVTADDYQKMVQEKERVVVTTVNHNNNNKNDFQEEMRCLECGCYGLPSEFINPKYCSYDCQENGRAKEMKEKELKMKRKRKRCCTTKKNHPDQILMVQTTESLQTTTTTTTTITTTTTRGDNNNSGGSDDDNTSNENSQDRNNPYPWTCTKKGFSWNKYLDHIKAKAAPVKLFKDPFPYSRNCFRFGMKLEAIDPQHPSYFCVLSVSEVCGYRVRLHFDGYPSNYDFWVNADSMDIFPAGWCEKYGHVLQPPPGYTVDNFNWLHYLKSTKASAAPKHLFANRAGNAICPNGFRVGMKLEAVDRKNTALVCVATVKDMMDNRLLIHFDSWDDIYDYWVDPTSPYIHPVGWCDQYGHNLTPPNDRKLLFPDYPSPEQFSWNKYLKETKAVAAPVRAFKQRPVCGFKRGMRLECVDKRVPQFIRAATVDEVKDHQLRIHFDGWLDRYSYWVDDDSSDIHPVGWCQKTGHPIETPLTPFDIYDFLECPTVGCRGIGHIRGPKYPTHSEQKHCPYAEDNVDAERVLPDRLLSPDRLVEAIVPVSREPKEKVKPRIGRPPKCARIEPKIEDEEFIVVLNKKPKRKYKKRKLNIEPKEEYDDDDDNKLEAIDLIEKSKSEPAEKETWSKHSKFLKNFINANSNPRQWTCPKVAMFVSSIPGCEHDGFIFELQEIDGDAFLSLNQKDLLVLLKMKVGPAVKLYNIIVLLRNSCSNLIFSS